MKFQGGLALAAMCFASMNAVGAVECTAEEVTNWGSNTDFTSLTTSCASYMTPGTRGNPDLLKTMCEDPKCGQGIKEIASKLPQCTVSGISITAGIDVVIEACKSGTFKVGPLPSTIGDAGSLSGHDEKIKSTNDDASLGSDSSNSTSSNQDDIKTPKPKNSSPPTPTSDAAKDLIVEAATTAVVVLTMMLGI